jgi:hypothetical protein
MKKIILAVLAGIILSSSISFFSHENSLDNASFQFGLYKSTAEEKAIEETLKLFNKHFATFFNTGGRLQGLNEFPAANMLKRRIFQEINEWSKKNQVIVYDKDHFEIETIKMLSPLTAVAVAREIWFLNVQDRKTRKSLSQSKANPIVVRYLMKKIDDKWGVLEYEVFSEKDDMPEMHTGRS